MRPPRGVHIRHVATRDLDGHACEVEVEITLKRWRLWWEAARYAVAFMGGLLRAAVDGLLRR